MAAAQKFFTKNPSGPGMAEVQGATAGGPAYAGQVPVLDPTTGLFAESMLPVGVGPEVDTTGVCGATSLTAGMFVNFYDDAGTKKVRPADKTDATKPAQGFVLAGYSAADPVTVYLPGKLNNLIPIGAFVAADTGKPLYLSTAGAVSLTRAAATGNWDQQLGYVINVGLTTIITCFETHMGIVLA